MKCEHGFEHCGLCHDKAGNLWPHLSKSSASPSSSTAMIEVCEKCGHHYLFGFTEPLETHDCSSFAQAASYDPPISREQFEKLKEQVEQLRDELQNGIKHDEERNVFVLVWTKRQIEDAQKRAEELLRKIKSKDGDAS